MAIIPGHEGLSGTGESLTMPGMHVIPGHEDAPIIEQEQEGNWLYRNVFEPLSVGWGSLVAQVTPFNMPGEQQWRERMAQGESWYQAGKETYREDVPSWAKVLADATNPVYWLPGSRIVQGVGRGAGLALGALGTKVGAPALWKAGRAVAGASGVPAAAENIIATPFKSLSRFGERYGSERTAGLLAGPDAMWSEFWNAQKTKLGRFTLRAIPGARSSMTTLESVYNRLPEFTARFKAMHPGYNMDDIDQDMMAGIGDYAWGLPKWGGSSEAEAVERLAMQVTRPTIGVAVRDALKHYPVIGKYGFKPMIEVIHRDVLTENIVVSSVGAVNLKFLYEALAINDIEHLMYSFMPEQYTKKIIGTMNPQRLVWGTGEKGAVNAPIATLLPQQADPTLSRCIADILEHKGAYIVVPEGQAIDMATVPAGVYLITPLQKQFIEKYHEVRQIWTDLAKRYGYKPYAEFEGDRHIFRSGIGMWDELKNEIMEFAPGGRGGASMRGIGGEAPQFKERALRTQADGVAKGVIYDPEVVSCLSQEAKWIIKSIRDQYVEDMIRPLGKTVTERMDILKKMPYELFKKQSDDIDEAYNILLRAVEASEKEAGGAVLNFQQLMRYLPDSDIQKFLNKIPVDTELGRALRETEFGKLIYDGVTHKTVKTYNPKVRTFDWEHISSKPLSGNVVSPKFEGKGLSSPAERKIIDDATKLGIHQPASYLYSAGAPYDDAVWNMGDMVFSTGSYEGKRIVSQKDFVMRDITRDADALLTEKGVPNPTPAMRNEAVKYVARNKYGADIIELEDGGIISFVDLPVNATQVGGRGARTPVTELQDTIPGVSDELNVAIHKDMHNILDNVPEVTSMRVGRVGGTRIARSGKTTVPMSEEFESRYMALAKKVQKAEKTPNRKVSKAEAELMEKDWKAFSRQRGYSEEEIADYQALIDMLKEGKRLGFSENELQELEHIAKYRGKMPGTTVEINVAIKPGSKLSTQYKDGEVIDFSHIRVNNRDSLVIYKYRKEPTGTLVYDRTPGPARVSEKNLIHREEGFKLDAPTKAQLRRALINDAPRLRPLIEKMQKDIKVKYEHAAEDYRIAEKVARTAGVNETYAGERFPGLGSRIFEKNHIEALNEALGVPSDAAKRWMNALTFSDKWGPANVSRTLRTATAALDFSAPFIQGLPLLGYDPVKWAELSLRQIRWAMNPLSMSKYMSDNKAVIDMWRKYGMQSATFEYFAGEAGVERMLGVVAGKTGRTFGKQTYGRAEVGFSGYGDAARVELAKAFTPMCKTEKDFIEAAKLINKMTGTMNYATMGIGQAQQLTESTFLFAPLYLRSGWYMAGSTMTGGMVGQVSREALSHFMAAGTLMYVGTCDALGIEPDLDPKSSGFMRIQMNGYNFSIGGNIMSMARLVGDAMRYGDEVMDKGLGQFWKQEGENPRDWFTRLRKDIPFLQYMYSKASPVVGVTIEGIGNTNYFGEELEGAPMYAAWLLEKTLPMAFSGLITEPLAGNQGPGPLGFSASVFGIAAYPETDSQKRNNMRNKYSQEVFHVSWGSLERDEQEYLRARFPDIQTAESTAQEGFAIGVAGKLQQAWHNDCEAIEDKYQASIGLAAQEYYDGASDGAGLRDKIHEADMIRRDDYDSLEKEAKYAPVYAALNDLSRVNPDKRFDVALYWYRKMVWDNPELYDKYGNYNYSGANAMKQAWAEQFPDCVGRIDTYFDIGHEEDPDIVKELRGAREYLSQYFSLTDTFLDYYGVHDVYDYVNTYINEHPMLTDGQINAIYEATGLALPLQQATDARSFLRQTNPQLNYLYQKFYSW